MTSMINRFRNRPSRSYVLLLALVVVAGLAAGLAFWVNRSGALSSPEAVTQQYLARLYAQDYARAYELISSVDKTHKSQQEYLRENKAFSDFTLEAARQLASYIQYPAVQIDEDGERTAVTVQFVVPDGNAEVVQDILFPDSSQGNQLSESERQALLEKLGQLHEDDQIPTFEGEQTFELVKEQDGWRIFENWAEGVQVHFSSEVKAGLAWEFEPLQEMVLIKPGQTLQTVYRAKNLSDQPIVAKARHLDRPEEYLDFLNILQCFCFIQQTLQPGEEVELPLVFRVEWDVPPEVKDFYVHYEFYPIESFPEEGAEPNADE